MIFFLGVVYGGYYMAQYMVEIAPKNCQHIFITNSISEKSINDFYIDKQVMIRGNGF